MIVCPRHDAFVMGAMKSADAVGKVTMVADGNADSSPARLGWKWMRAIW
jgi:peroxiredoxin